MPSNSIKVLNTKDLLEVFLKVKQNTSNNKIIKQLSSKFKQQVFNKQAFNIQPFNNNNSALIIPIRMNRSLSFNNLRILACLLIFTMIRVKIKIMK